MCSNLDKITLSQLSEVDEGCFTDKIETFGFFTIRKTDTFHATLHLLDFVYF